MLKTSPFTSWRFLYLLNFTVWYNYISVAIPFAPCFLRSLISYSHLSVFKFHIHDQNDHMNFRPPKNHKPWPFFSLHIINPHNPLDQISSIIHVIIPSFFGLHPFFGDPHQSSPRCLHGRDLKSFVWEDALAKVAKRFSRRVALSQWDPDVVARNLLLEKDGGHHTGDGPWGRCGPVDLKGREKKGLGKDRNWRFDQVNMC